MHLRKKTFSWQASSSNGSSKKATIVDALKYGCEIENSSQEDSGDMTLSCPASPTTPTTPATLRRSSTYSSVGLPPRSPTFTTLTHTYGAVPHKYGSALRLASQYAEDLESNTPVINPRAGSGTPQARNCPGDGSHPGQDDDTFKEDSDCAQRKMSRISQQSEQRVNGQGLEQGSLRHDSREFEQRKIGVNSGEPQTQDFDQRKISRLSQASERSKNSQVGYRLMLSSRHSSVNSMRSRNSSVKRLPSSTNPTPNATGHTGSFSLAGATKATTVTHKYGTVNMQAQVNGCNHQHTTGTAAPPKPSSKPSDQKPPIGGRVVHKYGAAATENTPKLSPSEYLKLKTSIEWTYRHLNQFKFPGVDVDSEPCESDEVWYCGSMPRRKSDGSASPMMEHFSRDRDLQSSGSMKSSTITKRRTQGNLFKTKNNFSFNKPNFAVNRREINAPAPTDVFGHQRHRVKGSL